MWQRKYWGRFESYGYNRKTFSFSGLAGILGRQGNVFEQYREASFPLNWAGEAMEIEKKDSFPAEDGHIESILIGVDQVKISFQTWDSRKLVILFDNVEMVKSSHAVYGDIGRFEVASCQNGLKEYLFYSAWYDENREEQQVLSIEAEKMEIYQVGIGAEMNSAMFDVGYEYIGDQECPYQ